MAGLSAGDLDKEVTIEQRREPAGGGYPVEAWDTLSTGVFMSRQDMRGRERFAAAQVDAAFDTKWEMQWDDEMDPDAVDVPATRRLVYRNRIYDITAAVEIGRRDGIRLFTIAGSRFDG